MWYSTLNTDLVRLPDVIRSVSCEKFPGRKTVDSAKNAAGAIGKVLGLPALTAREERCGGNRTAFWMMDKRNRKDRKDVCLAEHECHNVGAELFGKDVRAGLATDVDESWCKFFTQVSSHLAS